jgi:hypothetical protein
MFPKIKDYAIIIPHSSFVTRKKKIKDIILKNDEEG